MFVRHVLLLFLVLGLPAGLFAQGKGKITGTVIDGSTGETLVGVNVIIEGTQTGKSTDLDGNYTIDNLDPGTYTLVASYISYARKRITDIEVTAGGVIRIDFSLESESRLLGEITVSAEAIRNSEVALLRERQRSIAVSDAISAEAIGRSGSSDAGDAMKKVTGASVVGGKYVFIRGLGDRYSSTQLNGSELPSADPNRKSFQLDLFPSALLDNIVTLKTFTPDKPGSFSGGLVNVGTKDFPERLSFSASISSSYNTVSTGTESILPSSGKTDWLGFDNGHRAIPDMLRDGSLVIPFEAEARFDGEKARVLDQVSKAFNPEMVAGAYTVPLNRSMSIAIGNQVNFLGRALGFTGSLSYSNSFSSYAGAQTGRHQLIGRLSDGTELNPLFRLNDDMGTASTDIGGLLTASYKLTDLHKITATYLRTQSGSSMGRYLSGYWEETETGTYETRVVHYTERALASYQFKGKHAFPGLANASIDWGVSTSVNSQDEPDLRYFTSGYFDEANGERTYSIASALYPRPTRFFRDLEERNTNANVDISIPLRVRGSNTGKLKFGAYYQDVHRDFNERRFEYRTGSRSPITYNTYGADANGFFANVGIAEEQRGQFIFSNYITDASNRRNNYVADMDVYAVYGMAELPVTDKLKFVGGVRYEDAYQVTASQDSTMKRGINDNQDFLPSVNFIYALTENMNLRASYTHTVARPNFRELAPYATFDFVGDFIFTGNDSLKRTLIKNVDFRWEWFPSAGELISVSAFYKNMENPIERAIRIDANRASTIQNVSRGQVYGLEFEARKGMGFLGHAFQNFALATNLTIVQSIVDIPEGELYAMRLNDPNADDQRTLQGQSPFIVNADLAYDNIKLGFSANLNYNIFGDRLNTVALGAAPDIFERSVGNLDFIARKTLVRGVDLSLSLKNILDPDIKVSQKLNGQEYIYQSFKTGRTISVGLKYAL